MISTELPKLIRGLMQPDPASTRVVLEENQQLPVPDVNKGEHLIKVIATSPCAGELTWAKSFPAIMDGGKTLVPCYDLAGIVEIAPVDSPFPAGTEIWTRTTAWRTGNARQFTIAVTSELSKKPAGLTWEEAASIPLSGFTAYQALFDKGGLTPGWNSPEARKANANKRVLVTAAAGGVGTMMIQLAKAAGVGSIVAQTSTNNVDFVKSLGATEVVDYRKQSLADWAESGAEKVDVALDSLGGSTVNDLFKCIKDNGVVLSICDPALASKKPEELKDVRTVFYIMEPYGWQLDEIGTLVEQKQIKASVDSIWPFEKFEKAFEIVGSGHAKGKVIIRVQ